MKAAAGVIIGLILQVMPTKQGKEFSVMITIAVCCIMATVAISAMEPVLRFLDEMQSVGDLCSDSLKVILKAIGIGIIGELVSLVCADAGNASLGRALQILSVVIIVWLSLPLFTTLMQLFEDILENL